MLRGYWMSLSVYIAYHSGKIVFIWRFSRFAVSLTSGWNYKNSWNSTYIHRQRWKNLKFFMTKIKILHWALSPENNFNVKNSSQPTTEWESHTAGLWTWKTIFFIVITLRMNAKLLNKRTRKWKIIFEKIYFVLFGWIFLDTFRASLVDVVIISQKICEFMTQYRMTICFRLPSIWQRRRQLWMLYTRHNSSSRLCGDSGETFPDSTWT